MKNGMVRPGNALKVDSFLNHQPDVRLMDQMSEEFHRRFQGKLITRVLTIDDFLAKGCALNGLIAIEKSFQPGGAHIRSRDYQLESPAIVDATDTDTGRITFRS